VVRTGTMWSPKTAKRLETEIAGRRRRVERKCEEEPPVAYLRRTSFVARVVPAAVSLT
jgi:hypothetical protein